MIKLLLNIFMLSLWCVACVPPEVAIETLDFSEELVQPKHYIVQRAQCEILIDGLANESCWERSTPSDAFMDIEGEKPVKHKTHFKMLWDDEYLYLHASLEEPHVWGNLRQRDTVIFFNNDFEVFISPSGTTRNYGEIEVNALNTVWDLLLDKPYRDWGKANNHWNLDSLKTAVHVWGTLNNPNDVDTMWSVEMAIPLTPLVELKSKPRTIPTAGELWRFNCSRVQWDHDIVDGSYDRKRDSLGNYLPEYNWVWSNQGVVNMHEPEKWGYLQFTFEDHPLPAKHPDDELTQVAHTLYRKTTRGSLKHLLDLSTSAVRSFEISTNDTNIYFAEYHKTHVGFEYVITSNVNDKTALINESGQFFLKP